MILREVRHYGGTNAQSTGADGGSQTARGQTGRGAELKEIYRDYIGILINNELWRETLAANLRAPSVDVPKCLRVEAKCPAPFDEFGLLCKSCGLCSIQISSTKRRNSATRRLWRRVARL